MLGLNTNTPCLGGASSVPKDISSRTDATAKDGPTCPERGSALKPAEQHARPLVKVFKNIPTFSRMLECPRMKILTGEIPSSMKKEKRRRREGGILERLRQVARKNSNGDSVLEEVLLMNLRYNWGKGRNPRTPWIDEPHVVSGVKFWCVGHNASHEFYVGTDGSGKRFRYSVGESCRVDMDGNPLVFDEEGWPKVSPGFDESVAVVADFHGYYGHF